MRLLDNGGHSHRTGARSVSRRRVHFHEHPYTRGTSLTCRISDLPHPTRVCGASPQVECAHVVRLCRLHRALGIIVVEFFAGACVPPGQTGSVLGRVAPLSPRGGRGCDRALLHAYPGGGSLRGLPPSVNPSGNNIHTHTHTDMHTGAGGGAARTRTEAQARRRGEHTQGQGVARRGFGLVWFHYYH